MTQVFGKRKLFLLFTIDMIISFPNKEILLKTDNSVKSLDAR